jgi:uncharacterized protein DUF222/HNH endonuclease
MSGSFDRVGEHPASVAVEALDAALTMLAGANLWSLPEGELLGLRRDLAATTARLAAVTLAATREIDGRGAAVAVGAPSTEAWLRGSLHLTPGAAKEEVTLAAALSGELSATGAALAEGAVSLAHAAQIARAAAAMPPAVPAATRRAGEAFLLQRAPRFRPDQLGRLGRHLLHTVDPELGAALERDERDEAEAVHLTVTRRPNGSGDLRGHLDAEGRALLEAALDPVSAPRPRPDGGPDLRSAGRRRADGLLELVRLALACPQLPEDGGEPVQLLVTVPLATLEARLEEAGHGPAGPVRAAELADGTALSAEAARRLACDATIVAAVLGPASEVLDIGRAARAIPRAIRRALTARDGGCAFPGCDRRPRWCQAHHIVHWARGGPTRLTNLVLLCGHHHRVVHHHGWKVHIGPDGIPIFTPPRWVDPAQIPLTRPWRTALDQLPLRT